MQLDVKEIADKADMIINGYAFTKEGEYVRVLNLNCINHAAAIYGGKINWLINGHLPHRYHYISYHTTKAVST